ncbi:hypothetical protein ANCCAN_23895 [Ancylostoma caninum]|uniref:Uncharacterized protein n=1 Tax=Ancylostoma caninum TaxID=29170 RepID=A0A368FDW5_ANCCA|nr:hypothetical protein ANCCAN_23895 [Ancylostoma caninum]
MNPNVAKLIASHEGYSSAEDAYQRGREFISGREGRFVGMLTFPECGNRLCRLLNATYTDAFKEGRPVVLILRRRRSDRDALIILFGEALADDFRMPYGNCLMFVEGNEIAYTKVNHGGIGEHCEEWDEVDVRCNCL